MPVMVVGSDDGKFNSLGLPKPVFTWIGNMHGDETANRELLLRLVAGLCSGQLAREDLRWGALRDTTVVHIIPTMNPDGFALKRRYNARGADLNRNFWTPAFPYAKPSRSQALARDPWGNALYDAAFTWAMVGNFSLQPEAYAVTTYLSANPSDLSANLHGGTVVANYLMDACDSLGEISYCPSAEDPVPEVLAAAYSRANPAMWGVDSWPFVNGTVQGATWYTVLGSLQDWVFYALQRLQLTLELHSIKDPPAEDLEGLWQQNYKAMLRLMELSRLGLRARVIDATTRAPLAATVTVTRPAGVRGTTADATRGGYFYKPMMPGVQYVLSVQPYDPANPGVSYNAQTLRVRLSGKRDTIVFGEGLHGLAVERLLLAVRTNPTSKRLG